MNLASDDREFARRLAALSDGDISPEDYAALEERLWSDPAARDAYYDYLEVESLLQWRFAAPRVSRPAPLPLPAKRAILPQVAALVSTPQRFGVFFATVTTVSLLLFFAQIPWRGAEPAPLAANDPAPPAVSASSAVARWTGNFRCRWRHAPPGAALEAGRRLELEAGVAEITFASGARVLLEGPALLTVEGRNRGALAVGKLTALVSGAAAKGFTLTTPTAQVVDLGTEFAVAVDDRGATSVHVIAGEVEASPLRSAEAGGQSLSQGQALRVESAAGALQPLAYAGHSFVRSLPQPLPSDRLAIDDRYVAAVRRAEPLAYWRFENAPDTAVDVSLPLTVRDEVGDFDLTARGLVAIEGDGVNHAARFWGGAYGGHFEGKLPEGGLKARDYSVEFWFRTSGASNLKLPAEMGLVSVWAQFHDRSSNFIYLATSRNTASVSGRRLRALHRWPPGSVGGANVWHRTPNDDWLHVVQVKTADALTLYVQGGEVARTPDATQSEADEYRLVVGALGTPLDSRTLTGELDELAIYPRALSADEIQEHFRLAAPPSVHHEP